MKFEDLNWKILQKQQPDAFYALSASLSNYDIYIFAYLSEKDQMSINEFKQHNKYVVGVRYSDGKNHEQIKNTLLNKFDLNTKCIWSQNCSTHTMEDCYLFWTLDFDSVMKTINYLAGDSYNKNGGVCYKCKQFDGYAAPSTKHNNNVVCYRCFS